MTPASFNYTTDVVERLGRERPNAGGAALDLGGMANAAHLTYGTSLRRRAAWRGELQALGIERGQGVMTLMGARPAWVFALLGAWRLGAVAMPCSEQLRGNDIALFRLPQARPAVVLYAERIASSWRRRRPALRSRRAA